MSDLQERLRNFKPHREFFIGIDSDGCAFDTMEIKHKECFCPNTIKYFNLQAVSKYAREVFEFVNLYSKERGKNRFLALISVMDYLRERREIKARNIAVPMLRSLRHWIDKETRLGNPALKEVVDKTGDQELKMVLEWSTAVNASIEDMVYGIPPFPFVKEGLKKAGEKADIIVVSQTPGKALEREWHEHNIAVFAAIICGQECGTKSEHIKYAAGGKYPSDKILMIGDAYGDLKAAKDNDALFYPIVPGSEESSWEYFYMEALDRFFKGNYKGDYEKKLIKRFEKALPEKPRWK